MGNFNLKLAREGRPRPPLVQLAPGLAISLFLWLTALLAPLPADAAPCRLSAGDAQVDAGPHFEVLEDPSGALDIADVARAPASGRFHPANGQGARNFGYSDSHWWLRLEVEADTPGLRYLEIGYPSLDSVELFAPQRMGGFGHLSSGDAVAFSRRPLPHANLLFPVDLPAGPTRIYLRVASQGNLTVPATLWNAEAFHWHQPASYAASALYYGMLLALGAYNLLLFLRLRERVYLYYVIFLASMSVGISSLQGYAAQFLWPDWPIWTNLALCIGMAAAGLTAAVFSREFLDLRHRLPRLDRLFAFWIGWYAVSILTTFVAYQWAERMTSLGSIGFSLSAFVAGLLSYRRGFAGARFYLLAWTALLTGSISLAARNFGWLPTTAFTSNAFQIGSALEMLLLSFALADRLHTLKRLERQANTDSLTHLHNRRSFFGLGSAEIKRASRHGRRVAAAIIDADHFKAVNDTYGHAVGDRVLVSLARTLTAELRGEDIVGRLGGEEFAVLMPETDLDSARTVCERIRQAIEAHAIGTAKGSFHVTVSIGVAEMQEGDESVEQLLERADEALYAAKRSGRNQVCLPPSRLEAAGIPAA